MTKEFLQTYEVCSCSHVSLGEIIFAIQDGAKNLKDIQSRTDVGIHCKSCICKDGDFGYPKKELYCRDILEKMVK